MSAAPAIFMTPTELDHAIQNLPAEQRAQLLWAPERYRRILDQLLGDNITPELIDGATANFAQFCYSMFKNTFLSEQVETIVEEAVEDPPASEFDELKSYFSGTPLEEQVTWICDAVTNVRKYWRLGNNAKAVIDGVSELDESKFVDSARKSSAISFGKSQILIFALSRGVELGIPPGQMEKLAEYAYFETAQGVDAYALMGIDLDPLHQLDSEQRFAKTQRYVQELREVMTPEDVDTLSQARVTSL